MKLSELQPRVVRLLGDPEPVTSIEKRARNRRWYARNAVVQRAKNKSRGYGKRA